MTLTIQQSHDNRAAAALFGASEREYAARFAGVTKGGQWLAFDGDQVVGVAVAIDRGDQRVFVTHRVVQQAAFAPLLQVALRSISGPVYVTVASDATERLSEVRAMGLQVQLSSRKYQVPFAAALKGIPELRGARRFVIRSADQVDRDELFALDAALRRDVPGNDGWAGNRPLFYEEMQSSTFDPTGYQIAIGSTTDALAGLCRMWRNDDGPSLGMLGVLPRHRTGLMAADLLRKTLMTSSSWGSETFATHTARPGLQKHLQRAGAAEVGGFIRFVRP